MFPSYADREGISRGPHTKELYTAAALKIIEEINQITFRVSHRVVGRPRGSNQNRFTPRNIARGGILSRLRVARVSVKEAH